MGLLYQDIMKVPGLTGTWAQRNKQLYYKLGAPYGAYEGNGTQNNWLVTKLAQNNNYASGLPGATTNTAPQTTTTSPEQQLLDATTSKITPQKSFSDVVDKNVWNGVFDEWTRNFANTYMLPEWQRNTYNPAMQEAQKGLDSMGRQVGLAAVGRGSGGATGVLDEAARAAIKQEEDLRTQYQSNLAALRGKIQDQWATPLYGAQMTDYMNSPWANLNLGTATTGAGIDTSGLGDTLNAAAGTNLDLNSIINGLNVSDYTTATPQTYDWTVQGMNTTPYTQYLLGQNRYSGRSSNLGVDYASPFSSPQ